MAVRSFSLPALPTDEWMPPPPAPAAPARPLEEPHPWPVRRRASAGKNGRAEFCAGAIGGFAFVVLPVLVRLVA